MGLFDKIFGRAPKQREIAGDYKVLTGYAPVFFNGPAQIYESQLIRAAINARATHISKLRVTFEGHGSQYLAERLRRPNEMQTWSQLLYRIATIWDVDNNVFIIPVFDRMNRIREIYPVLPSRSKLIEIKGRDEPWLAFEFANGRYAQLPIWKVGVMTKFQYKRDYFGESNRALDPTMKLINMNEQATIEGMKSAATFRFMASYSNVAFGEDLAEEQRRFNESSMDARRGGGLLLFPATYNNPKQIESKPFVMDAESQKQIADSVYNYYGVNEDVLQGKASGDKWAAFYESAIEPFAIQFSEVMTKMLFTLREQSQGNKVTATANRIQYMSNRDKLEVTNGWADRGMATIDELREIWNMPPLPDGKGEAIPIRGEYYDLRNGDRIQSMTVTEDDTDEQGN